MEKGMNPGLEVRVFPLTAPRDNLLAFASITVAGCFAVRGLKVLEGRNGPFVAMPQMKDARGEWKDVCFPTTTEMRKDLNSAVLDAFQKARASPDRTNTQNTARPQAPTANRPALRNGNAR